jgi:hypothetical protein
MTAPLPFTLRIPDKDDLSLTRFTSTRFRFQGRMRLTGDGLMIEWGGVAKVEELGMLGMNEETVSLPHESLTLPLDAIATARLRGGWWRPRLEITSSDLETLRTVPSEDGGRVSFWIERGDRRGASNLVRQLNRL